MILQRIREAERDMMFEEYRDRVGELITGIVQQKDSRYTLIQLRERVEALLPKSEQVDGERYEHNQRIKAVIKEVSPSTKGPSIIVSRRDPELIKKLFELEVPEIADGLVEIANVAREPGYRSKIAVVSHADGVDPVGACVGPRGSRVRMVVSELRGEKIDIIPYNDEPARFVAKALSPARVREVLVDDDGPPGDGRRARRPALAGHRPRGPERAPGRAADRLADRHQVRDRVRHGGARTTRLPSSEETSGRCAAILGNGRRCPNASLPGSRYCGLDSHQALDAPDTTTSPARPRRADRARRPATPSESLEAAPPRPPSPTACPRTSREAGRGALAVDRADAREPAPEAAEPDALAADAAAAEGGRGREPASRSAERRCVACGAAARRRCAWSRRRSSCDPAGRCPGGGLVWTPLRSDAIAAGVPAPSGARYPHRPRRIDELMAEEARARDRQGTRHVRAGRPRCNCAPQGST